MNTYPQWHRLAGQPIAPGFVEPVDGIYGSNFPEPAPDIKALVDKGLNEAIGRMARGNADADALHPVHE